MSFASEVKKELLSLEVDSCCKDAIVAGILQGNSEIVLANLNVKVLVKSPLSGVLRYISPVLKKRIEN
jgi:DNA-binding transcriptional regulator WhiA